VSQLQQNRIQFTQLFEKVEQDQKLYNSTVAKYTKDFTEVNAKVNQYK